MNIEEFPLGSAEFETEEKANIWKLDIYTPQNYIRFLYLVEKHQIIDVLLHYILLACINLKFFVLLSAYFGRK